MYYAHKSEDGVRIQTLYEHLQNVGHLSEAFSNSNFKELAKLCGIMHDIGKACPEFQKRLDGAKISVEHSIGGAQQLVNDYPKSISAWMAAYCIAGHHTGLPDGGHKTDTDEITLQGRLKNNVFYESPGRYEMPTDDKFNQLVSEQCKTKDDAIDLLAFAVRYIYSCLTDADFIDTEGFFYGKRRESLKGTFKNCYEQLIRYMGSLKSDTPIKMARNKLLNEAVANAKYDAEIYLMNMPTGSGKTLCSIRTALERIKKLKGTEQEKRRIIYVIPYTSIIEQTADIFNKIFEEQPILQHHSAYYYELEENDLCECGMAKQMKMATENWDADFIITTNIQFFESLYSCKSSRARKIHNMADSIIIFDEIHMMPVNYLGPCIKGIGYITKNLNSEAILLTATMPDFAELFDELIPFCRYHNLITDRQEYVFRKCSYEYIGEKSLEKLTDEAGNYSSVLFVMNKRNSAKKLYGLIKEAYPDFTVFHLSTYLTGYDRSKKIELIKRNLNEGERVIIVSTSLIEVGVDIDCEAVYRELTGLDSILQAGGRCNREGLRQGCKVRIFKTEEYSTNISIAERANITRSLFDEFDDISSHECINEYYRRWYKDTDEIKKQLISCNNSVKSYKSIPFRSYSSKFKFIDGSTIEVAVMQDDVSEKAVNDLRYGSKAAARLLRRYSASIYQHELKKLMELGAADDFETGIFVLTNSDYYNDEIGIVLESDDDKYIC